MSNTNKKETKKFECKVCGKLFKEIHGYKCCSGLKNKFHKNLDDKFYCMQCVEEKHVIYNLFVEKCTNCKTIHVSCIGNEECVNLNCDLSLCYKCYKRDKYTKKCNNCLDEVCTQCPEYIYNCEQCNIFFCEDCVGVDFECTDCGMTVIPIN